MNTITARLILVLTGCLAAIFAAGLLLDYRLSRDEILERLRLQSIDTVESAITDMDNWLDGVEGAALFLAELVEGQDFDREQLEQLLQDIVEQNGDIFGAAIALNPERAPDPAGFAPYYFRRDGALRYADLASEAYHYRDRDWYRRPAATGYRSVRHFARPASGHPSSYCPRSARWMTASRASRPVVTPTSRNPLP